MRSLTAIILSSIVGAIPVTIAAHGAAEAGTAAERSKAQFERVSAEAREYVDLQSRDSGSLIQADSTVDGAVGGLVNRVSDALTESGMVASTLANLAPESEVVGETIKRQAARLTLQPLTLRQLGRFLQVWRERQPRWTVSSIQLTPWPPPTTVTTYAGQPPAVPDTLRATVVIEAFVASSTGEKP